MNTHEEYVTYAQAKALKELSFDWPCKAWWESEYGEWIFYDGYNLSSPAKYNHQYNQWMFSAPSQAVACRWLREVKKWNVHVYIVPTPNATLIPQYWLTVFKLGPFGYSKCGKNHYPTYEEAVSEGIDRALELLKLKP